MRGRGDRGRGWKGKVKRGFKGKGKKRKTNKGVREEGEIAGGKRRDLGEVGGKE